MRERGTRKEVMKCGKKTSNIQNNSRKTERSLLITKGGKIASVTY